MNSKLVWLDIRGVRKGTGMRLRSAMAGLALTAVVLLLSSAVFAQENEEDKGPFVKLDKDQIERLTLQVGTKAPDFEVQDFEDNMVSLGDFAGEYLVLVFWATTGDEPKMLVSGLAEYADYFEVTENLELFGIAAQKHPSDVPQYLADNDLGFLRTGYTTSPALVQSYKATRLPITYVIDPGGTIIGVFPNYSSRKVDEIMAFLVEQGIGPESEDAGSPDEAPDEEEAPAEEEPTAQDPEALEIIRAMCDVYKGAEGLKYTSVTTFSWEGEEPGQETRKVSAVLKKPNLVRAEVEVDTESLGQVVSDGTNMWEYMTDQNQFIKTPAPASLSQPAASRLLIYVSNLFFQDDPFTAITSRIEGLSLSDDAVTPSGDECRVLVEDFGRGGVYRVFVDRRNSLVLRVEGEISGAGPGGADIKMVEDRTWVIDPTLPGDAFEFTPPEGATEAEVVPPPMIGGDEGEGATEEGGEEGQ